MLNHAHLFAQADGAGGGGAIATIINLITIVMAIAIIVGFWKLFEKAGKPGWASLVPIYNLVVMLEIAGRPIWWIILFLIPCVNIFAALILCIDIAKSFGKDTLYGLGLFFLGFIFFPLLGFGDARYVGPKVSASPV